MKPIILPESYNYIGVFLTMRCNYKCSYCINRYGTTSNWKQSDELTGTEWVVALRRIQHSADLPITLSGGEPTLHKSFFYIAPTLYRSGHSLDLLTNGNWSTDSFMNYISHAVFKRNAPYASIRFSYHPGVTPWRDLVNKVIYMKKYGYHVGIWGVNHPEAKVTLDEIAATCRVVDVDFRLKDYLGMYKGQLYGSYSDSTAVCGKRVNKKVKCKTTELLVGPNGDVFRCHHNLYARVNVIGNLLDPDFAVEDIYRECHDYGLCNPCDGKIKHNRYQVMGHCSVNVVKEEGEAK